MTDMPTNETLIETEYNDPIIHAYVHTENCIDGACDGPHCPPAPAQLQLHVVHCTMDETGTGELTIDGHDVSNRVARGGVTIQSGNGRQPSKIYLEMISDFAWDGPAEVHIIQGAHAVEFLQSVNRDHLTQAALQAGFNRNPIDVALEVLIEMAQAIETGQAPE